MSYVNLIQSLRDISESTLIRKKSHIAYQGEVPRYGYFIMDGAVKAYVISSEGSEMVADIFAKNTFLPVAWLNRTASTALFYYETINDVRALRFTRQNFENILSENREAKDEYMRYLINSQTSLLFRNVGLSQSSSDHKICYALYLLVFRYGVERDKGHFLIPIPMAHELIGNFIGQSRENTAKMVKKLSNEQLFTYDSKTYLVNLPKLESYLGEKGFRELVGSD